jgi:type VI secretion system protein ImpA
MSLGQEMDVASIATDAPCGPDLFVNGDAAFMNFTVKAEGVLPSSFYSKTDGAPFDRQSVDLPGECKAGEALALRTHDIRLLGLLTKLHALNRDASQVVGLVEKTSAILEKHWDDVHPRAEDGDYSYRMACLQALDDNAHIILPLQYSAILRHPRAGDIGIRTILLATGKIEPRDGEQQIEASEFERAMGELDLEALRGARDLFGRLADAVAKIRSVWLERAGYDQAVRFDLMTPFATKARDTIAAYVVKRDPGSEGGTAVSDPTASGGEGGLSAASATSGTSIGMVGTFAEAEGALSAAAEFFARNEPSNPALPLIRQAQQLMGKSFVDVLRILAPNHMEAASLKIGKGPSYLPFPVERLTEFSTIPEAIAGSDGPRVFKANTRQEAVSILAGVNAFYAKHEPSSPLPLFTERASSLSGKDFLGIIKDILPEDAMQAVEKNLS